MILFATSTRPNNRKLAMRRYLLTSELSAVRLHDERDDLDRARFPRKFVILKRGERVILLNRIDDRFVRIRDDTAFYAVFAEDFEGRAVRELTA
jgi:hypothetical protein